MEEIKNIKEAIETLNEAGGLLNMAEDKLHGRKKKVSSLIETAYLEISDVLGYLKKLNKEKK